VFICVYLWLELILSAAKFLLLGGLGGSIVVLVLSASIGG
jgi:hypothetical protein